jgi:hypothetical protein
MNGKDVQNVSKTFILLVSQKTERIEAEGELKVTNTNFRTLGEGRKN